jgi:hypothetical protein
VIDDKRLLFDPADHSYTWEGFPVPGVSQIIDGAGFKKPLTAPGYVIERKAAIGLAVHKLAEMHELGQKWKEASFASEARPYFDGFLRFLEDTKPQLLQAERKGFNESYYYAGTLDREYFINGQNWIVDLKCSRDRQEWWPIQLTLYGMIFKPNARLGVLHLTPRTAKGYSLIEYLPETRDARAAVLCYHYKARHGIITGPTVPEKRLA